MAISLPTLDQIFTDELRNESMYDGFANSSASHSSTYMVTNKDAILWNLNEKLYFDRFLPATMYIGAASLFGCIGNGVAVCVYNNQKRKNTANMFIFTLGIVDLLICMFVMPCKLFDMRFPLMFGYPALCKCFEFFEIFLSMASLLLMMCIAFDRYFIVARPLKRMTIQKINRIVTICPWIAVLMSWPTFFIYGESKQKTSFPQITGSTCGISFNLIGGLITKIWYFYLFAVFVIALVILVGIYSRIWFKIRTWQSTQIGENVYSFGPREQTTEIPDEGILATNNNIKLCRYIPMTADGHAISNVVPDRQEITDKEEPSSQCEPERSGHKRLSITRRQAFVASWNLNRLFTRSRKRDSEGVISIGLPGKRVRMRRNTLVFGAISVVFVLSYLPCLVVLLLRMLRVYNVTKVPTVNARIAEVFVRSGYINHVLNPYIYSFLCPSFRKGFKNLMCRIRRQ